ncbi:MAG TPA: flagellar assembly protein FliH [Methylophilaceae bacterium]
MAAKFIPLENSHGYQPWQLADLDEQAVEEEIAPEIVAEEELPIEEEEVILPEEPPQPQLPSADDIGRIYHDAHREGYEAGLVEGLEAGHAEGFAAGHAEGLEAGHKKGYDQAVLDAQPLAALFSGFATAVDEVRHEVTNDAVTLALEIAQQMLREALKVKPKLVIPLIKSAMEGMQQGMQHPEIHLNPDDALLVRDLLKTELAQAGWRIVEDHRIDRGGCRIECTTAEIDATMPSRWKRIAAALGQDSTWLEHDK